VETAKAKREEKNRLKSLVQSLGSKRLADRSTECPQGKGKASKTPSVRVTEKKTGAGKITG